MKSKSLHGFTLVEIMIVIAIIGIILAIAVPAYIRARENARGLACQENLGKLDGAKIQYSLEKKAPDGVTIPDNMLWNEDGTGYLRSRPDCPSDGDEYIIGAIGTTPTCPNYDAASGYVIHIRTGTL